MASPRNSDIKWPRTGGRGWAGLHRRQPAGKRADVKTGSWRKCHSCPRGWEGWGEGRSRRSSGCEHDGGRPGPRRWRGLRGPPLQGGDLWRGLASAASARSALPETHQLHRGHCSTSLDPFPPQFRVRFRNGSGRAISIPLFFSGPSDRPLQQHQQQQSTPSRRGWVGAPRLGYPLGSPSGWAPWGPQRGQHGHTLPVRGEPSLGWTRCI